MTARVVPINSRELIAVRRSYLSEAAENAIAANLSAKASIDRALNAIWSGNRAAAIHHIGRIGFEVQERTTALQRLTALAENATACPDQQTAPGHGAAA